MYYKKFKLLVCLIIISSFINLRAQKVDPPFIKYMNHPWVDSVLNSLSTRERIAQLIWVAAFSKGDIDHEVWLSDLIRNHGIGGVIFFQGEAARQAQMINYFQRISKVPLMVVTDGEWGLAMRLPGIEKFPYNLTMGAINNDSLIYEMGTAVAGQFKRAGININLAPVADLNNNPQNPVINFRSFGENPVEVSGKALMFMKGLQDNGIISVAKHFPGHGDTGTDSHLDLPVIRHTKSQLDSVDLVPFRSLINAGITCIMPGHISLPLIDSIENIPATISYNILTKLLRDELSFNGLILSDAMNMAGIKKYAGGDEVESLALKAGMDVLEYISDPEKTINLIMEKINRNEISPDLITEKCRKVLAAKYQAGLNHPEPVPVENIAEELAPVSTKALIRELYANSLTLLSNKDNILPVKNLDEIKIATLAINKNELTKFQQRISDYFPADNFFVNPADKELSSEILDTLSGYDIVLAGIFGTDQRPQAMFGIKPELPVFLENLITNHKTVVTYFGNPYALNYLEPLKNAAGVILAYEENDYTEDLSAQLIFGGIGAKGLLPVTINNIWKAGYGLNTPGNFRLQYGYPESAGISSEMLNNKIDSIAKIGLDARAYPGCEVMVARKGIVVFHKTYGYHTYDNRVALDKGDLFDLASVTKISSSLPALMILDTQGKFSPDKTLGNYLPEFKNSNKSELLMKELLTHQAGLTPYITFWKATLKKDTSYKKNVIRCSPSDKFPVKVANGLYINKNYRDKIFNEIKKSPLGEKKYVYSDLTFILTPAIVERLCGENWTDFITKNIYHKIGAYDIVFNPYLRYSLSMIVPTENDTFFRMQQLQGTVHDEGAAMLGGISGHAGLFATANDLMKLMELYRRMGEYGGEQIIGRDVMKRYTSVQFPENNNRRGLGFDKPLLNNSELPQREAYPTKGASPESFGHSGYTGTFVWVDPVKEISYVFFSNRVYPTRNNNLLSELNIRTEILQAVYDAINEK